MKSITLEQAKQLKIGTRLFHMRAKNVDGSPQNWRVSGQVQTWKKDPLRVSVPLKRGLYNNIHLTERNLYYFSLTIE